MTKTKWNEKIILSINICIERESSKKGSRAIKPIFGKPQQTDDFQQVLTNKNLKPACLKHKLLFLTLNAG